MPWGFEHHKVNHGNKEYARDAVSGPNNLFAEIRLAADATVLRKRPNGTVISNQDQLIRCARFGSEGRHNDASIRVAVNGLARDERADQITLMDPFGLYIDTRARTLTR